MVASTFRDCEVLVHASSVDPLVSVVVAIYNMEESGFLEACLNSLADQMADKVEFVLCDDASTDGSLDLALSFAAGRDDVSVVHLLENKKQGAARNRGIDVARGAYIAIVDADDMIMPGYFDSIIATISDSGADCVFPGFIQKIDEKGMLIGSQTPNVRSSDCVGIIDDVKRRSLILNHGSFAAVKRSVFDDPANRYLEGMAYEDTPAAFRWWLQVEHVEVASGSIYCYRMNPQSTIRTTAGNGRRLDERLVSSDMILDAAEELGARGVYRDEVEEYYMSVYLFNTFGMVGGGCLSKRPSGYGIMHSRAFQSTPTIRTTNARRERREF